MMKNYLKDIRVQFFYMDNRLINESIALYCNMALLGWVKFTFDDGIGFYEVLKIEPMLHTYEQINYDFDYPILKNDALNKYIGYEICSIYKYEIRHISEGCLGFYIKFSNELSFSFIEIDDKTNIVSGFYDFKYLTKEVSLTKIHLKNNIGINVV